MSSTSDQLAPINIAATPRQSPSMRRLQRRRARQQAREAKQAREPQSLSWSGRKEKKAYILSLVCHLVFVAIAATIWFGANEFVPYGTIATEWDSEDGAPLHLEQVELTPRLPDNNAGRPEVISSLQAIAPKPADIKPVIPGAIAKPTGLGGAFFGVGENGQAGRRIVYLVDSSASMRDPFDRVTRFTRVRSELSSALKSLSEEQHFSVLFFNKGVRGTTGRHLQRATGNNTRETLEKIWKLEAQGGTDPRAAINRALAMKPDTIFFLTDGLFMSMNAQELLKGPPGVVVHTFTLGDSRGEQLMQKIAEKNNGTYRFIKSLEIIQPDGTIVTNPDSIEDEDDE